MDDVPRRGFCAVAAAVAGLVSGCTSMAPNAQRPAEADGGIVVSTREELEAAFANLSAGDTVYVSGENVPYRTTEWLDVDVDGVDVVGPGVRTLIAPADGANVGGIRIGHHRRCREIDVRGVGYYGNPEGQRQSASRLHGIAIRNARNVTLTGNQIRGTYPRRHGDGGSGISVAQPCSGVRIFNNRITEFGDRGIQLGGSQHAVFSNVITTGLDRPIACDLWFSERENRTAQSVSIFGNLLGHSVEGSLVGVARNDENAPNEGFVGIFGNVGFGSHKSFCHLRGPAALRNVSVQNNVSRQETDRLDTEETTQFAGVSVDVDEGRNIAIRNNELYEYSGPGIRVKSTVTGLSVQNNNIFRPQLDGLRIAGGTDGIVDGNLVVRAGEAGIRLRRTANLTVSGNYVRAVGTAGIVEEGSIQGPSTDITGNFVTATGRASGSSGPGILVDNTGIGVHGNVIKRHDGPAIAETHRGENNHYADNRSDGTQPWQITSPTSVVRDHSPPMDVHRHASTGPRSDTVWIPFERPYAEPPRLTFGRTGGGIQERRFTTDEEGNFVGVELTTVRDGETVDVFVDDG